MAVEMHTVIKGETLSGIVFKKYGTTKYVQKIAELNDIADPDVIRVGQEIMLPLLDNIESLMS
ncbi:LysM peptidoglycan-binding domain-containing protein [Aldersonia kunmingensis]|uniref:LysM peptidoglycan-binding domain-containing protein n=1 Tax=Aldersonia kunmingensis TaxID=408066 RepID=UPI000836A846|nr:LysM domain-containing protein [Aldersonia kunmingensis]